MEILASFLSAAGIFDFLGAWVCAPAATHKPIARNPATIARIKVFFIAASSVHSKLDMFQERTYPLYLCPSYRAGDKRRINQKSRCDWAREDRRVRWVQGCRSAVTKGGRGWLRKSNGRWESLGRRDTKSPRTW